MKKNKPNLRLFFVGTVLTCFVVMVLVVTTGLFIYHLATNKKESVANVQDTVTITSSGDYSYSKGQLDEILGESEAAAKNLGSVEVLAQLREGLESGTDILSLLRTLYPDDIVVASAGTYKFHTINKNLQMHGLLQENIKVLDDGEMQYLDNGKVISHKGIDVSKFQGEIDWTKVRDDGIEYAFVRAGLRGYESGQIVEDDLFAANMAGANDAGVPVGVYFFSQALNEAEALEEADFVLNLVKDYKVQCPIVYDVEKVGASSARMNKLNPAERTAVTIAFCKRIKEAGYEPMIYANMEMFTQMLDLTQLEGYEKWYAFYDTTLYYPYKYTIWQYSEKGNVAGINGKVDMNISFTDWSKNK